MNLSRFEELKILAEIVSDFQQTVNTVTPLLVAAMARDLLLHYSLDVPLTRATQDIDFAFVVPDWGEFDTTLNALILSGRFKSHWTRSHRLTHRCGLPVDLVPFGGVENSDQQIEWPHESTVMSVYCYREAQESAINVILPADQTVHVVYLPMLALLKLYAWSDRHIHSPRKDAEDLFLILFNYLKRDNTERLYTADPYLFEADDFDYEIAGAWLAGPDVAITVSKTSKHPVTLVETAQNILEKEIDPDGRLKLVGETMRDAERSLKLLTGFYEGLTSTIKRG